MPLRGTERPLAEVYDTALLDLDGVVYVGPDAVPSAPAALQDARGRGMRLAFVTNNASRTPEMVATHLTELGVPAVPEEVSTSAQATARLVAERVEIGSRVLVVGGEGLRAALRARGMVPVDAADKEPVAVAQGFSPDVTWALLAEGAFAVRAGLPWLASNLDLTIPTTRGIAPGNGTLVQVVATATGRRPDAVAGKPELALHREAVERSGASRPLVVGDRLDTDIEGAVRARTDSLLVLTGVTGVAELLAAPPHQRPTFVAETLEALGLAQPRVTPESGGWRCGGWLAAVVDGAVRVEGSGDRVDALRAACAATWSAPAPPEVSAVLTVLGG
jgi:glycerol 3-phosphatase-2